MTRLRLRPLAFALLVSTSLLAGCVTTDREVRPEPPKPFPEGWTFVDLTRPLDWRATHLPHPRSFPFERIEFEGAPGSTWSQAGFMALEQMGTHLAAPRARRPEGATVEALGASDLVLPLIVIDGSSTTGNDAVPLSAVLQHELAHGLIPQGALVVLRTGLGELPASDPRTSGRTANTDTTFPGWSPEAVAFLIETRGARALGTDAPALDPGSALDDAPAQSLAAREGRACLAGLRGLAAVPAARGFAVIGALPIAGGTGAPARVIALIPPAPPAPPPTEGTRR